MNRRVSRIIEITVLLCLGGLSLLLTADQLILPTPWLATWGTVLLIWLLPGFLLLRMTIPATRWPWFAWLPLSFGLGLAWLMVMVTAGLIVLNSPTITQLSWSVVGGNHLLLLIYIIWRLWDRPTSSTETVSSPPPHGWLFACGIGMIGLLLLVFFSSRYGVTTEDDEWTYMMLMRSLLDAETITFSLTLRIWYVVLAILVYLAEVPLLEFYHLYLHALLMLVAILAYLLLADTLFNNQDIAYFSLVIQGLYFLSDIYGDSNGAGLGLLGRLLEDKFTAYLLILPFVQIFFLKFIQSAQYRYLFWFAVMALVGAAIDPIAVTWFVFSIGSVSVFLLLFRRQEQHLRLFYLVFLIVTVLSVAGAWSIRSGYMDDIKISSFTPSTALPDLLTLSARRVLILSMEQNS